MMETVLDYLKEKSVTHAEKLIICSKEQKMSFMQLADLSCRFASGLRSVGLKKGDRFVIALPNSSEYLVAYYGSMRAGCISVSVNPDIREDVFRHILRITGAAAVIHNAEFENKNNEILRKQENQIKSINTAESPGSSDLSYSKIVRDFSHSPEEQIPKRDDPVIIQFTISNQRMPEACVISHSALLESSKAAVFASGMTHEDRITGIMHFSNPLAQTFSLNSAIITGATVLPGRSETERDILGTIVGENATVVVGDPIMFEKIIIPQKNIQIKTDLRIGITSHERSGIDLSDGFERIFNSRFMKCLCLAETTSAVTSRIQTETGNTDTVGIPFENVKLVLIDESGEETFDDNSGELSVKSPMSMIGTFFNDEIKPNETDIINTGLICRYNSDGEMILICHKDELINKGGFLVNSVEIEDHIKLHPEVEDAAVIGIDDTERLKEIKSYIVASQNKTVNPKDIIDHVKKKFPVYKCPKEVVVVDTLPKDENGRTIKRLLK